jgi:hypothetical protein
MPDIPSIEKSLKSMVFRVSDLGIAGVSPGDFVGSPGLINNEGR